MNILDPILHHCRFNAPAPALCAPGTGYKLVSYGRLERFINNVSRKGASLGLSAGHVVALFPSDRVLHVALMLGLTRLGVVTVSGRNPNLPKDLRLDALITDSPFPYQVARVIPADASWLEGDGTPLPDDTIKRRGEDELARIVLTSGTTGLPKAVGLTHRMMVERIARHAFICGHRLPDYSRTYCDLGFATSLAFQFLLSVLWRGGTFCMAGRSIAENVEAFGRYQIQNMISAPSGVAQYLKVYEENPGLQCNFEMVFAGGSLMARALSERARARMCANLIAAYGSTETEMVASAPAHLLQDVAGAVGYVFPDQTVEIVDAEGRALPAGAEGTVRIRGPYNVSGYIGDAHNADSALRGGWFYPGDIGRLTADGLLVIAGRETAMVNLGGEKLRPELVEETILTFAGIDEAAVFGRPNELGIEEPCALVVARNAFDEAALRAFCAARLPAVFVPVRFISVKSLPRNAMGKLERSRLAEIARAQAH